MLPNQMQDIEQTFEEMSQINSNYNVSSFRSLVNAKNKHTGGQKQV